MPAPVSASTAMPEPASNGSSPARGSPTNLKNNRLASTYKAALVDMEAAGIARLAAMRGIPFYCIKGVSDALRRQNA